MSKRPPMLAMPEARSRYDLEQAGAAGIYVGLGTLLDSLLIAQRRRADSVTVSCINCRARMRQWPAENAMRVEC